MRAKIRFADNGPLILESPEDCLRKDGKPVGKSDPAFLCRCGHSKNKPFCDGSHKTAGFDDTRAIDREKIQNYPGRELTVHFNRSICAGAALCVRALPTVFDSESSEDWIRPDGDDAAKIVKVIRACPSGALSYTRAGSTVVDARENTRITVVKDGPYHVEGAMIEHPTPPTHFSPTKYALCRCGRSGNKPFCDYSHAEQGWTDGDPT